MAIENCSICEKYGFVCNKANWFERLTGREKIVTLKNGRKYAHDFTIETCEVVTGKIKPKAYAQSLNKHIDIYRNRNNISKGF